MDSKKQLLIILLIVLGASISYRLYKPSEPEPGTKTQARSAQSGEQRAGNILDYEVRKHLLAAAKEESPGDVINIFSPLHRASKGTKHAGKGAAKTGAGAHAPEAATLPPVAVAPPPPPPKTPEQLAAEASAQELGRFRFLGFLKKADGRSLFIGRGDELMVVREGETVKGLYNIKQIGNDYFVLSDPGTGVEKKVELSGK